MRNRANIRITLEALKQALGIPDDVAITGVYQSPNDFDTNTIKIGLEGDCLPQVLEGNESPVIDIFSCIPQERIEAVLEANGDKYSKEKFMSKISEL